MTFSNTFAKFDGTSSIHTFEEGNLFARDIGIWDFMLLRWFSCGCEFSSQKISSSIIDSCYYLWHYFFVTWISSFRVSHTRRNGNQVAHFFSKIYSRYWALCNLDWEESLFLRTCALNWCNVILFLLMKF